jgi:putative nucleotidyltransferase with HDIG domain
MTTLEDRLAAAPPVAAARAALGDDADGAWIVGGTLRDALLGRAVKDVDLAVAGDAQGAARAVARAVDGPAFPLSKAFGAWRAMHPDERWVCDVSPLQGETIEDDLRRRDFTVNAMAVPLGGGELLDPCGGREDLDAGVLRVVGGPELERSSYAADPLRPLRLARLTAETPLRPDRDTERLTAAAAARVVEASPERVFAELRRLVIADGVLDALELADRLGLVAAVLPEVAALHAVEQSHFHHLDVYEHTVEVLRQALWLEQSLGQVFGEHEPELSAVLAEPLADELTRGQALRFAALLHDIGKPATRGVTDTGRVTFIGHDAVGAEMIGDLCRRLRTSERFRSFLADVTRHHLHLGFLVHERPLSRETVYRYLAACAPVEIEVTVLTCADRLATRGKNAEPAIAAHLELAREVMGDALRWRREGPPRAPLRGDELAAELGIEPGPELGRLLARLAEAAFTGEAATREAAVELARRLRENERP